MTLNRKLTNLLSNKTVQGIVLENARMSITFTNGSILSFNTTEGEPEVLEGTLQNVLDDETNLRLVTVINGTQQAADFGLTSNPAVLVRDTNGAIVYAD